MKIFVSNLSFQVTADELRGAFITFNNVGSVFIVKDRATGKSKGFGYVEITPDVEAKAAIDLLSGKLLKGRAMLLKVALPPLAKKVEAPGAPPNNGNKVQYTKGYRQGTASGKTPNARDNQGKGPARKPHTDNNNNRSPGRRSHNKKGGPGGQGSGRRHQ